MLTKNYQVGFFTLTSVMKVKVRKMSEKNEGYSGGLIKCDPHKDYFQENEYYIVHC